MLKGFERVLIAPRHLRWILTWLGGDGFPCPKKQIDHFRADLRKMPSVDFPARREVNLEAGEICVDDKKEQKNTW